MRAGRIVNLALLVFVVVLVNAPYAHSLWTDWRIATSGTDITAQVTGNAVSDSGALVLELTDDRLSEDGPVAVRVDRSTYDDAIAAQAVDVRVLDGDGGDPPRFEVEGQVRSRVPLVFTVAADLALLAGAVLLLRFRAALRPELVLRATADLERCEPGSVLDRVVGNEYVVAGAVHAVEGDEVVLDLGDRRVRVVLDGHDNPAGLQQPVRATGVMIA